MTALGQQALIQHLTELESLDVVARQGLELEHIPTEALHPVFEWVMHYYYESGRQKAPSLAVMRQEFGDLLADHDIDIETEPDDSIEWAIRDLKATWVSRRVQEFLKEFAIDNAKATTDLDRVAVADTKAGELLSIVTSITPRSQIVDAHEGLPARLVAYREREAEEGVTRGLVFNLPEVDIHTGGTHPGELCILAAPPKTGKSYFLARTALREWQRGMNTAFFNLENDNPMTLDRLVCLALGIDSQEWQQGKCEPSDIEMVSRWLSELDRYPNKLTIFRPEPGRKTVEHMVRMAQSYGADRMIIDQLTWIDLPGHERHGRTARIGEALHTLVESISMGHTPIPCFMAHQINREGQKAAEKAGKLEMYHLAEASECERTAHATLGLLQSNDQRATREATLSVLAARRFDLAQWELKWDVANAAIEVMGVRND